MKYRERDDSMAGNIRELGTNAIREWLREQGYASETVGKIGLFVPGTEGSIDRGVWLKTRSNRQVEYASVNLFESAKRERERFLEWCVNEKCEPWIAVYVETSDWAHQFLLSMSHFDRQYPVPAGNKVAVWYIEPEKLAQYEDDSSVLYKKTVRAAVPSITRR
jgi:hypothetical protein